MILTSKEAAVSILKGELDFGVETLAILDQEVGAESLIAGVSQRMEMNVIKYGTQFNAIRNGLYDLVEYKGTINTVKDINKLEGQMSKLLGNIYLAELGEEIVPTIEGLTTKLSVFTAELYSLFRDIEAYGVETIDRVDNIISDFIGKKDVRDSFIQLENDLDLATKFNVKVKSIVDRNFGDMSIETTALKNLFGNNAEYMETVTNLVKLNKIFTNKELGKIEKKVSDVEARFEILLTVLKDDEELKSRPSVELLIKTLDILSKFLTNLSAAYYFNVRSMDTVLAVKLLLK
ncbi:MAG: hypothetical protein DRP93_05265 [Candidatus Neomarinimicrobiota bacterium]|nr:MAG: hypothetical protein DRP93_05265 [Candidatus Neomarinimicrobiota bacterium]